MSAPIIPPGAVSVTLEQAKAVLADPAADPALKAACNSVVSLYGVVKTTSEALDAEENLVERLTRWLEENDYSMGVRSLVKAWRLGRPVRPSQVANGEDPRLAAALRGGDDS